jgi:hypothetical protein
MSRVMVQPFAVMRLFDDELISYDTTIIGVLFSSTVNTAKKTHTKRNMRCILLIILTIDQDNVIM